MDLTVYKIIQVVGTSNTSFSDAVKGAVERASSTLDDLRWFEVKEMRGRIADGGIAEFQVKVDIAFHLHAPEEAAGGGGRAGSTRAARSEDAPKAGRRGKRAA